MVWTVKILFLAASPTDRARVHADREYREIGAKIRASKHRDEIALLSRWAVRATDLTQALLETQPEVVHFASHGTTDGEILLLDRNGQAKPVSTQALGHLFHTLKDNIRLVVFNACMSVQQAEAISQSIDFVIGMRANFSDHAASEFAATLYLALGHGRSVGTAFDVAKSALMLDDIRDHNVPQLCCRQGADPTTAVLVPAASTAEDPPSPAPIPPPGPPTPKPDENVNGTTRPSPTNTPAEFTNRDIWDDDPIFGDLRAAYRSGNLIVFAGAGIGVSAGLPTWHSLAQHLLDRLRRDRAPAAVVDEAAELIRRGQYIDALSAAKHALGAPEFGTAVERALDDRNRAVPALAMAIAALAPKLKSVLTTNLDHLLERALGWPAVPRAVGDIATRKGIICKIHGTLLDRSTWVFSREQYDRAMFAAPALQNALGAIYRAFPILFVGCGLADDNLDQTFGTIRALAQGQPPTHYAIVPQPIGPARRRALENAGIRLICYDNRDGNHGQVTAILRWLAQTS